MEAELSPTPAILTLTVTDENGNKSSYRPSGVPITIGRGNNNHLILNDSKVSRNHLKIDYRGDKIVVVDLGSKNGTYIDGKQIPPKQMLIADGKITLGLTQIELSVSNNDVQKNKSSIMQPFTPQTTEKPSDSTSTQINQITNHHSKFNIELLSHFSKKVLTYQTYKKFTEIASQQNIKNALTALKNMAITILPDISEINYLFFKNNGFFLENFSKTSASEFADCYRFVHDEEQAIIVKTTDGLEVVKKVIVAVTHNGVLMFLMDMDINKRLTSQQIDKLLEIKTLVDLCSPSFESFLLRDELDQVFAQMLETLVTTVEAKDTYTHGHSERVCRYSTVIGEELDLTGEQKKHLIISALCHDIGKIAIPDAILKKPTLLSVDEFAEMKSHPNIGADMVRNIPGVQRFISGIKYHHERWNGTGYPDGLHGENIPLFARIISIADSFDAMTSGRTYSSFMVGSEATSRLSASGQELFDPEILKVFISAFNQGRIQKEHNTLIPEDKAA